MVFCPVWGPACFFQGLPTSVAPRPAAAAVEKPVGSWHLHLRYRSRAPGLKSTMGKMPGGLLTGVLRRA